MFKIITRQRPLVTCHSVELEQRTGFTRPIRQQLLQLLSNHRHRCWTLGRGNKYGGARADTHYAKVAVDFKGCLLKTRRHARLDHQGGKVTRSVVLQDRVLCVAQVMCFIAMLQVGCSIPGKNQAIPHSSVDLLNKKCTLSIY